MSKKSKSATPATELVVVPTPAPVIEATLADVADLEGIDAEVAEDIARKRSVVKAKYKVRYAQRAREAGSRSKVQQRSCWDWLASTLAAEILDDKQKLVVERFLAILDANGVDHSRWTNRSKGWEGRLRMTGRLALQRVVAESEVLHLPDGEQLVPPAEWIAHYRN